MYKCVLYLTFFLVSSCFKMGFFRSSVANRVGHPILRLVADRVDLNHLDRIQPVLNAMEKTLGVTELFHLLL